MKIQYVEKNFHGSSLAIIEQANDIIADYESQGYSLTLRQLYYQFVARDILPNTMRSYKRLQGIISDGRLAGLISWEAIEDRTRNLSGWASWETPREVIESARSSYHIDMWKNQPTAVEVWIEKEALVGIIERVCYKYRVPYFACRGYVSQSELWSAGQRAKLRDIERNQRTVILHLGDHDPSGMDMTRDNYDRINMFAEAEGSLDVERLALNMNQVEQYKPPPNPAKVTDSRFEGYRQQYGEDSWELDALEPKVINQLIEHQINIHIDQDQWDEDDLRQKEDLDTLDNIIDGLDE